MEELGKLLLENSFQLIASFFTLVLFPAASKFLHSLYYERKAKFKNYYLAHILELCEQSVRHQYQVRIKELKKRVKISDGVSDEERKFICNQAKEEAVGTVREIMKGFPALIREMFDDKIEHFVESTIPKIKAKDKGVPGINPTSPGTASN